MERTQAAARPGEPGLPRVCFVAHNALGALAGRHAGGIERQQTLMAGWLARQGYPVSMITWDEGVAVQPAYAGVELLKLCRREAGLPGLRFIHPRWTSLNRNLSRADADIYYYNLGDMGLGQIALWTKARGKILVFSVASDTDVQPGFPALKKRRERWLYRYGLAHCNRIIVQTEDQRRMLQRSFGRDASVLPMPCEGIDVDAAPAAPDDSTVRVLWVGRISAEKRPDWLLDIAERLPDRHFEIVGAANTETVYARTVVERARAMPNVTLSGRLSYERMLDCYKRASILCSTSAYEGFPNIYLEAWSAGIPVVATCDPDQLIAGRDLGRVGSTVDALADSIEALARSPSLRRDVGARARAYFAERHTVDRAMLGFARLFDDAARERSY